MWISVAAERAQSLLLLPASTAYWPRRLPETCPYLACPSAELRAGGGGEKNESESGGQKFFHFRSPLSGFQFAVVDEGFRFFGICFDAGHQLRDTQVVAVGIFLQLVRIDVAVAVDTLEAERGGILVFLGTLRRSGAAEAGSIGLGLVLIFLSCPAIGRLVFVGFGLLLLVLIAIALR